VGLDFVVECGVAQGESGQVTACLRVQNGFSNTCVAMVQRVFERIAATRIKSAATPLIRWEVAEIEDS
jgi:hypothetical protein